MVPASPYEVLGLSRRASASDVRTAYRAAARACHPDKGGDPTRFAAARSAFEVSQTCAACWPGAGALAARLFVFPLTSSRRPLPQLLSDPAQRAAYDDLGDNPRYKGRAPAPAPRRSRAASHFTRLLPHVPSLS